MIDISDGIAADAPRLAAACGCGAVIWLERLPRAAGASVEQAAAGGEDYELLAALPPQVPLPEWMTEVGELRAAAGVSCWMPVARPACWPAGITSGDRGGGRSGGGAAVG